MIDPLKGSQGHDVKPGSTEADEARHPEEQDRVAKEADHSSPQSSHMRKKQVGREQDPGEEHTVNTQSLGIKSTVDSAGSSTTTPEKSQKEKKPLKFDSKGKLVFPGVHPPRASSRNAQAKSKAPSGKNKSESKLVVTIPYRKDEPSRIRIGRCIDAILGEHQTNAQVPKPSSSSKTRNEVSGKALHPFFVPGHRRQADSNSQKANSTEKPVIAPTESLDNVRNRNSSAATPGKLRAQAQAKQAKTPTAAAPLGFETNEKRSAKHLGLPEALWPSNGTTHVRGPLLTLPRPDMNYIGRGQVKGLKPKDRKRKDGILNSDHSLPSAFVGVANPNDYAPESLKLPERLLISGQEVQRLTSRELKNDVSEVEPSQSQGTTESFTRRSVSHPRLSRIFERLASTLTPFDRGLRETEPWIQKYAPSSAEEVLQSGPEARALRDWLKTLSVKAVDKGHLNGAKTQSLRKDDDNKIRKKKRKKRDDIDDFIVSSDEEDSMMEHVEHSEDDTVHSAHSNTSRSIFRVGDLASNISAKLTNAVLLSGPHGCGKTATVYAVAKELGFEVFELNSGSRRGGKELLEKVGDMAENHLYQSKQEDPSNLSADEETARHRSALRKDLDTGRQGTMTSFFGPKSSLSANSSKGVKANAKRKSASMHQSPQSKGPSKQKQSLILLEEADVLFEEDKQFWSTLATLAVSSKRPIIMTCNDENLVPPDALNLHAILRCAPPSLEMVTEYLLLMATNEGHLISRSAVSNLFLSRGQDLRATIQQLDFWCQMGIGDKKGGLEWIYQRWPPGQDHDADGNRLRVVSRDTYNLHTDPHSMAYEDGELVGDDLEGYDGLQRYSADGDTALMRQGFSKEDLGSAGSPAFSKNNLEILDELDLAFDGRSAADVFRGAGPASKYKVHRLPFHHFLYWFAYIYKDVLDPTEPRIDDAARTNFIEGYQLIQADLQVKFAKTDIELSRFSSACANSILMRAGMKQSTLADPNKRVDERTDSAGLCKDAIQEKRAQPLHYEDFLATFEPLTDPGPQTALQSIPIGASVFDGPLTPIIEDAAPYVRSIVAFDLALEEQRLRLSNLLSQGGRNAKKARLTRASRSALEGGKRETTRRERWFTKSLNASLVLRTGGRDWRHSPESSRSEATSRSGSIV